MAEMRKYLVRRAAEPVRLAPSDRAWEAAQRLAIDQYPWYKAGARQATDVALLYDERAIYVLFVCADRHIHSVETRLNGNVYLDSCVEFFAIPDPGDGGYFNFEANCCGCVHLGYGPGRPNRKLVSPETFRKFKLATSIPTPTKTESPQDNGWWLAAELPLAALSEFVGYPVSVRSGGTWRANFFRCGGKTDDQYASWNPIQWPKPDFHRPEFFGALTFE